MSTHRRVAVVAAVFLSLVAPTPSSAETPTEVGVSAPGPMTTTRIDQLDPSAAATPRTRSLAPGDGVATAAVPVSDIVMNYAPNVPAGVQPALDAAALAWETRLVSDVPIVVDIEWRELPEGVLGSAGPVGIRRDFEAAPLPATWYPSALANALAGRDFNGDTAEMRVTFSSEFTWHFDPDTPPPAGAVDLATVATHEFGHGLGFIGTGRVTRTNGVDNGTVGSGGFPLVYDRFMSTEAGTPVLNIADGPDLAAALTSGELIWNGPAATAAFGEPPLMYSPSIWRQGSSYSHFDEDQYPAGDENALMTPALFRSEIIRDVGAGTVGAMEDMGWPIAGPRLCRGLEATIVGSGTINGTSGPDVIIGSDGDDTILGFGDDDTICGLGGNDTIRGFAGDDWIDAGPGDDDASGGNGNDTIFGGPGIDKVKGEGDDDEVAGGPGADRVIGGPGQDDLFGGPGNDVLRGEDGNDVLNGGDDNDIVAGNNGDDTLIGGPGADEFRGGPGNDTADYSNSAGPVVVKLNAKADDGIAGEGDMVDLGVENVIGSPFSDLLIGSDSNNMLTGLDGDDVLLGRSGDDTTDGGIGTDECNGNGGTDVAIDCETVRNVP